MIGRLSLVASVAMMFLVGGLAPASAGLLGFLDPSRHFSDRDEANPVTLVHQEVAPSFQPGAHPAGADPFGGAGQHVSEPQFVSPKPVNHWLHGGAAECCEGPDPYRDGWYLGLSGGTEYRERVHEIPDNTTFIDFDMGFNANAFIGYRFHRFRLEAEGSYMNNEVKTAGSGGLVSNATGNISMKALMFNGYYDFRMFDWKLSPYLGAGIGVYQSSINSMYPAFFPIVGGDFNTNPVNCVSDVPMAYQLMAGVSYPLGNRTEAFAGYRYFRGDTLTFSSAPFAAPSAPFFQPNGAICHNVEVGLRIKF